VVPELVEGNKKSYSPLVALLNAFNKATRGILVIFSPFDKLRDRAILLKIIEWFAEVSGVIGFTS